MRDSETAGYERTRQPSAGSAGAHAVKQHDVWLVWSSAFLIPWAALYLAKPAPRSVMWRASLATTLFGLAEPSFVPAYRNPPPFRIGATHRVQYRAPDFFFRSRRHRHGNARRLRWSKPRANQGLICPSNSLANGVPAPNGTAASNVAATPVFIIPLQCIRQWQYTKCWITPAGVRWSSRRCSSSSNAPPNSACRAPVA